MGSLVDSSIITFVHSYPEYVHST